MPERAKIAAIALAFLALFGFLIFQAGVASKYPQTHHQQAASAQDHEQKNIFERFWEWTTEDPVAVYTLVLAISTIGLWFVTGQGMRNQSREMRVLQRAYLSVEPGGIHPHNERGQIILRGDKGPNQSVPHIRIQNVGHLPAREIKWLIEHKFSEDRRLNDFPVDEGRGEGRNVLPPGGAMTQGGVIINVGKGPGELDFAIDRFLYVWGIVVYDDGFGEKRRTRFCHRYNCVNLEYVYDEENPFPDGRKVWIGRKIESESARYHRYGNDAG